MGAYAANHGGGYEGEGGTRMLATQCLICGRPLRDPESLERGVGPYCAQRRGMFTSTGSTDEAAFASALDTAPEGMRESVSAALHDPRKAVSAAIHAAGKAWETHATDWGQYVGSAMEIAQALGYGGTASALREVFIEGRKYDEEGNQVGKARPKGVVVSDAGSGMWQIEMPYLESRNVWKQTNDALKGAGARNSKDRSGNWQTLFRSGEREWLLALNALVDTLAGTLGILPSGETFIVPHVKLPVPAPPGEASGAPTTQVTEPKPDLPVVKEGDTVELNDGRVMVVARTGTNSKGAWIGLMSLDDAEESKEKYGYLFFKRYMGGFCGLSDVKAKVATTAEKKAVEEDTGTVVPERAGEREIPEGLFDWQREGVIWLDEKRSGILAFQQGTGKSPTALAALDAPVLVIVPASLRENWKREANRWRPDLVVAKIEKAAELTPEALKATCVIIGYDALADKAVLASLKGRGFKTLIVDEAQAVKELVLRQKERPDGTSFVYPTGPKRAIGVYRLAEVIKRKFFLTGTPMINGRPYELWPLLYMVAPTDWANQEEYWWQYCDPKEVHIPGGKVHLNVHGHANLAELRERVNGHYMLRKTKEVLNLPEKKREYLAIGLSEEMAKEYREAANEFLNWVRRHGGPKAAMRAARAEVIARLTALRRLCAIGKAPTVIEHAHAFLRDTGRPLIIAGHHEEPLASIEHALSTLGYRVGTITGKVTGRKREQAIDEFQTGLPANKPPERRKYLDVLVCSITAAGVGLTLTRAQDMMIFERVWRPFDLVQMEDRIHRYGQKNECVVTYFDAAGTIDDKLAALLAEKTATAAQVIDGVDLDEDEAQDKIMSDMFESLTGAMQSNPAGADMATDEVDWANPDVA